MFLLSFPLFLLLACSYPLTHAQSPSDTSYTSDTLFRDTILNTTNTYRHQHNASALSWNDTLASAASEWSARCEFEHSGNLSGENLAAGYANVTAAIDTWALEREKYDYRGGEFSTSTGHFTQLVWKSTTSLGCARTACNAGTDGGKGDAPGWFLVCEYWPGGNVIGGFRENVQAQIKGDGGTSAASRDVSGRGRIVVGVVVGVVFGMGMGW